MVAVDNVLVHLGPAVDVVGLDRQHLLQRISRAVCFQSPDLHLPETLTTELRLTTQRLLGNQTVRAGRTRVHLVVDQVVDLEHVHVAYGNRTLETIAGPPVVQPELTAVIKIGQTQHFLDLELLRTIEYRRRHGHTARQVVRQLQNLGIGQRIQVFLAGTGTNHVVDFAQELADIRHFPLRFQHPVDLVPQAFGGRTQVRLQNLSHVHPRRYAQRVEDDVDRVAMLVIGHVFHRHDHRDHTLVPVTTSYRVTRLHATLHRNVDFHDLQHTGRQIVASLQLALLVFVTLFQALTTLNQLSLGLLQNLVQLFVGHPQLEPVLALQRMQVVVAQDVTLGQTGASNDWLTGQYRHQTLEGRALDNAVFVVQVLAVLVEFGLLDFL